MIPTYFLLEDMKKRFTAAFVGMAFREPVQHGNALTPSGGEKYREPRVYVGNLPPKEYRGGPSVSPPVDQGEDVPYILVKLIGGAVSGEQPREYRVKVAIIFEVFVPESDPEAGLQDLMNIAERLMAVLSNQRLWCGGRFEQELPIEFSYGSGQAENPYLSGLQIQGPYYGGAITTQFKAAALPQEPPQDIIDAGEPAHPAY